MSGKIEEKKHRGRKVGENGRSQGKPLKEAVKRCIRERVK
jgi:hypothetical protein